MMLFHFAILVGFVAAQTCHSGGIYSEKFDRCYQYFTAPTEYEYAEEQCVNHGGHLASIENSEENALIQANAAVLFEQSIYPDFWIGASGGTGYWTWTDGSPFSYTNWHSNTPQYGAYCVVDNKNDGTWVGIACNAVRPFVCIIPPSITPTCPPITTSVPSTCPPPTPCPTTKRVPYCDSAWTYYEPTNFCYKVYHNKKWDDAEKSCNTLGAHLVSIHSSAENTFVNNLASIGFDTGNTQHMAWIGMSKRGNDWVWSDGTTVDYQNWAPKKPDNPKKEHCVQTATDKTYHGWYEVWNNIECDTTMRAYVCKKAPNY